jgi:hypothetical protein
VAISHELLYNPMPHGVKLVRTLALTGFPRNPCFGTLLDCCGNDILVETDKPAALSLSKKKAADCGRFHPIVQKLFRGGSGSVSGALLRLLGLFVSVTTFGFCLGRSRGGGRVGLAGGSRACGLRK